MSISHSLGHRWVLLSRGAQLCILFCWLWICVSVSTAALAEPSSWKFQLLYLGVFGLALVRPVLGLGVFFVFMPWLGGSQPGNPHTIRFIILLAGLSLGLGLRMFYLTLMRRQLASIAWSNPLVFAVFVYWLVALFSLSSVVPTPLLWGFFSLEPGLARELIGMSEGHPLYPWVSFLMLTLSGFVFYYWVGFLRAETKASCYLMTAILLGMLLTVTLGIFDYYDFINLKSIRPADFEAVNGVNYRFEHLNSVFGNPSWTAQYLVLCAPSLLAFLFLGLRRSAAMPLMILAMVLTEFCIILIYQRGGWLSYPLTLVVIWFCIYVLNADSASQAGVWQGLRRAWLKIALSLPITVAVSLFLVYQIAQLQPAYRQQVEGFVARAESIKNVNDRLAFWAPTSKLLSLHPLLGGGIDSYTHQYEKAFMFEGHPCVHDDPLTTDARGSAHNLYFQTLVGKGVVGLLSLFGVMVAALSLAWRGVFQGVLSNTLVAENRQRAIMLMVGFAYTLALAIYGNVGEIFYSPVNTLVFFAMYAATACAGYNLIRISLKMRCLILSIIIGLLGIHVYLELLNNPSC